jgi:hypothetical protein
VQSLYKQTSQMVTVVHQLETSVDTYGYREMAKMQHHYKELNISSGPFLIAYPLPLRVVCMLYTY